MTDTRPVFFFDIDNCVSQAAPSAFIPRFHDSTAHRSSSIPAVGDATWFELPSFALDNRIDSRSRHFR